MARQTSETLPPKQLEIMTLVWERGEATVADIWKVLAGRRGIARNTVQTTMSRLETLGWLKCRVEGQTHYYSAARAEQRVTSGLMSRLLHGVFGGSPSKLVLALLDGETLSTDEAARIRKLIDQAERRNQ